MAHYIFIASNLDLGTHRVRATEIADVLISQRIWLFSPIAPFRNKYADGDRCLLYLAGEGNRVIVADAILQSGVREASLNERKLLAALGLNYFSYAVDLIHIHKWAHALPLAPLVDELSFIRLKKYWGHHFRQAATRIPEEDFNYIVKVGTS